MIIINLEIFNNLANGIKDNKFVQSFIEELANYLSKGKQEKGVNELEQNGGLKEEGCLYQVVDRSRKGVYLQNKNSNKVCEETDIPKETLDKISNDYFLRYTGGKYVIEEELTEKFFNNLEDIEWITETTIIGGMLNEKVW